jgi:hypothetical protein
MTEITLSSTNGISIQQRNKLIKGMTTAKRKVQFNRKIFVVTVVWLLLDFNLVSYHL